MSELRYQAVAATHIGQRLDNEDSYLADRQHNLMVVADGVGGHDAGDLASAITCTTLERHIAGGGDLVDAIHQANREVYAEARRGRGKEGMASTAVALLLSEHSFELAWVGDSRAYLWDGQLKQLSSDHSVVGSMLARGEITREEAHRHPSRNVISQAIGLQSPKRLRVGCNHGSLQPGQLILLCSDGVTDVLDDHGISHILQLPLSLESRCMQLVSTAVGRGGQDNATAILVEIRRAAVADPLVPPNIVWCHCPATEGVRARQLQPIELVDVELDSGRLPPEITQTISIADVERELQVQAGGRVDKPGLRGRLRRWLGRRLD